MEDLVGQIRNRIEAVEEKIATAAHRGGRSGSDVRLVVVTKAQPIEVVEAVLTAGATVIGENYPEETLPKLLTLKPRFKAEWHMIGHLQSRKAVIVAEHFDFFQSLDRFDLAEKMQNRLQMLGRRLPVLLEFNTGGEASKSGWEAREESHWPELVSVVRAVGAMPNLDLRGLMTMPPLFDPPELARPFFSRLRRLRDFLTTHTGLALPELSMGTSTDYETAVEEGATLVRIGTAIVGQRPQR
jgi:hypothetical protein